MQMKKKVFCFLGLAIISLSSLQCNDRIDDDAQPHTSSVEMNVLKFISYLPLFANAHEEYLKKGNVEPAIKCNKCGTQILSLWGFEGGLIGIALRDLTKFQQMQPFFDDYLKILSAGIPADVVGYMVRTSNDIKQVCSHCQEDGCSWTALDE